MAVCGFLGLLMTQKMLGSLSELSGDSAKPTKMIAEQKKFCKDYENGYSFIKLLNDTFDRMNLNEIENSKL